MRKCISLMLFALTLGVLSGCNEEASTFEERTAKTQEATASDAVESIDAEAEPVVDEGYTGVDVAMLGKTTLHQELPYKHTVTAAPLRLDIDIVKLVSVEADEGAKHMVKNAEMTHFVVIEYRFTNISDKPIEVRNDASYIVTSYGEQVNGYAFEGSFTGGVLQPGATKHGEINFETVNSSEHIQYFTWFLDGAMDAETYQTIGQRMKLELEIVEGSTK